MFYYSAVGQVFVRTRYLCLLVIRKSAKPPDLVIIPAGIIPTELKDRLKQNKSQLLRNLKLEQSMHGLEADRISVARFEDGSFRVFVSEGDTLKVEEDRSIMYWQPAVLQTILLKLRYPSHSGIGH